MRKYLLTAGTLAIVAALAFTFQRPLIGDAAVTVTKITDAKFKSVTRDDTGKATAVVVSVTSGETTTEYTFAIVSTSLIKDKQGLPMNSKYLTENDVVSLWVTKLDAGNLIKIVDKSVWRATVTGKTSEVNDDAQTFAFRIDKFIREISQNATYSTTVRGQTGLVVRQLEIKRTGNITTRTQKTRTWTEIDADQTVIVTGYWNSVGKYITATKIQLPDLRVTS